MIAQLNMNFLVYQILAEISYRNMNALHQLGFSNKCGGSFSQSIMNGLLLLVSKFNCNRGGYTNTIALTTLGLDSLSTVNGNFNLNNLDGLTTNVPSLINTR
jgi:hypothetical protein